MKNLITSLKKLGNKMTGEDVTGADLVTVVDNIAEGYSSGGGGGGGAFYIHGVLSIDGGDVGLSNVDAGFTDVLEAYQANMLPVLLVEQSGSFMVANMRGIALEEGSPYFGFIFDDGSVYRFRAFGDGGQLGWEVTRVNS